MSVGATGREATDPFGVVFDALWHSQSIWRAIGDPTDQVEELSTIGVEALDAAGLLEGRR